MKKEKALIFLQNASDKQKCTFLYASVCAMDTLDNITETDNEKEKIHRLEKLLNYQFAAPVREYTVYILAELRAQRIKDCLHSRLTLSRTQLQKRSAHWLPDIKDEGRDKSE